MKEDVESTAHTLTMFLSPKLQLSCQHALTDHDARIDVNPVNSSMFLKGLALILQFALAMVPSGSDDRL